jgi:hypothetical protein
MTTDAERSHVREIECSAAVFEPHDVVNLQVLGRSTETHRLPSRCLASALAFCQRAEFLARRARFWRESSRS